LQPQDDFLKGSRGFDRVRHGQPLEMLPFHRQEASKGQWSAEIPLS
jgi:hypothetical protein